MSRLQLQRASLAVLAAFALATSAHTKASTEFVADGGGGGGGGVLKVTPIVPPGAPPTPVDTSTFVWTGSPGLFFFPDFAGGNTVTSAPGGVSGVVVVSRRDGGLFEFGGVDYAYSTLDLFLGDEALHVQGFVDGGLIGNALFNQPISNAGVFSSFGAGTLAGLQIDELRFDLDTLGTTIDEDGFPLRGRFSTSIRNIVFADTGLLIPGVAPIPEPATWALMIGGFGLAGMALRRRTVRIA